MKPTIGSRIRLALASLFSLDRELIRELSEEWLYSDEWRELSDRLALLLDADYPDHSEIQVALDKLRALSGSRDPEYVRLTAIWEFMSPPEPVNCP